MPTEMGEHLVGAYLKPIEECDFVDYAVRVPGGRMAGLNELDVVGIHFGTSTAFLCEVATDIRGLDYGGNRQTIEKLRQKYQHQNKYANTYLAQFQH